MWDRGRLGGVDLTRKGWAHFHGPLGQVNLRRPGDVGPDDVPVRVLFQLDRVLLEGFESPSPDPTWPPSSPQGEDTRPVEPHVPQAPWFKVWHVVSHGQTLSPWPRPVL